MIADLARPRFFYVDMLMGSSTGLVCDDDGLRLVPDTLGVPPGPLSFDSPDGSVGRLTGPRGWTIDRQQRCFFVERSTGTIWFFDPLGPRNVDRPFSPILRMPTGSKNSAGSAHWSLAAYADSLYVIRPGHHELAMISLRHWSIQELHGFVRGECPLDVATHEDRVAVLTDSHIYVRDSGRAWDTVATFGTSPLPHCSRLLFDSSGEMYVYSGQSQWYHAGSRTSFEASSLAAFPKACPRRFPVPPVIALPQRDLKTAFQYALSAAVTTPVSTPVTTSTGVTSQPSKLPPELIAPQVTREMLCRESLDDGFLIREDGVRVYALDAPSVRLFSTGARDAASSDHGSVWLSPPIDSALYRCTWDRVELTFHIPSGCQVTASTATDEPDQLQSPDSSSENTDSPPPDDATRWSIGGTFVSGSEPVRDTPWSEVSFPVRSLPGRVLYLKLELQGDGFSTPVIHRVMARGPRQSSVAFLPAVLREDDQSRDFLERFVGEMQSKWDEMEGKLDRFNRQFDPLAVDPENIQRLATWIGIPLPAGMTSRQYQSLMKDAPDLMMGRGDETLGRIGGTRRGTVAHLRIAARSILRGITELKPDQMRGFPWVIEGHRERNQLRVKAGQNRTDEDRLSAPAGRFLAGSGSNGPMRLGENSVLGEHAIRPSVRAELELYETYAHRIRVVVPACWLRTANDERMLQEMLDSEKPAHVACSLKLVRAGLCLGRQSTLGVDTILGDWPLAVLSPPSHPPGLGPALLLNTLTDHEPSLPVEGVMGHHTL